MSGNKRPPNEIESRLHQAALNAPSQEISPKQAEAIAPDPKARQSALNFLLGVGLFKSLKDNKGNLLFRAVSKNELVATRDLSGEENLVLSHIKSSGNEGIWTKHLKAKTNLHQTVIDRCLKTLIQKRLIKRVPSVQHPTRKIYMLEGLEPSIALTGGPWYTDNELDTEFIQHLMDACYKFICDISFPKRRESAAQGALFPISNAPEYPSAQHIRNSLRKARLTETDLSVEHVEALLNVLVLDGKIEALPAFGTSLWDSAAIGSDDEDDSRSRKKRKHGSDDEHDRKRSKRKRSKKPTSDDESSDDHRSSSKKKSKRNRSPSSASESDSEADVKRRKRKDKKAVDESDASGSESNSRPKSKKRKKKRSSRSSDSDTASDSDSDHRSRRSSKKPSKRSPSPFDYSGFDSLDTGGGLVYRAVKEEAPQIGWSQAPCALCPSFEFCKKEGPVNPQDCVYYEEWLAAKPMTTLEPGDGI